MTTEAATQPVLEQWSPLYPFNKNRYALRLMDKTFKQSSKGNPMIEFEWEIVHPTSKEILVDKEKGTKKMMGVAGLTVTSWLTFTEANMKNVREFYRKLGLPLGDINPESPDMTVFDGLIINTIVSSRPAEELSDDIDAVTGQRKPILDDNGKPIIKHYLRTEINDVISRNTTITPTNPY